MLFAVFNPALAAVAVVAAVGLPFLIHLLFRKRHQIVPWAAMRFLLVAERRHRRRIDQWVLLALRVLGLLLPLFAMIAATSWAEPLWQSIKPGATETISSIPRTHHVIVLDASMSMSARADGGASRFEKAVDEVERLVRTGSVGDGYTLLALAGSVQLVVPGPSNEPEKVVAELRKVKQTHAAADISIALPMIADVVARSPRAYPRRQVTFVTDSQRSAWMNALPKPDAPTHDLWQRIFNRAEVASVDVAQADLGNVAVTDFFLVDPLPLVDSSADAEATITNFGSSEARNVRVQLLLGRPGAATDALVAVQQSVVDVIQPGGRASVAFGLENQIKFREKGLHVLQARLVEPDDLHADDVRSLVVPVRDGIHAVLVDGSANPEPLHRAAGFLNLALFPPTLRPSEVPGRPKVLTPAEFADPVIGDLSSVDCVYLCDLPTPTLDLAAKLDAFLKRGGGIVVGLGPNSAANISLYNKVLYNEGNGILPGPILEAVTTASPDAPGFRFTADDEEYRKPPLLEFRDDKARGSLIEVPFRTYLRIDAPEDGRARRILSFAPANVKELAGTRKPDAALVEWKCQRGRVVVFTSSFNEDWNDWPRLLTYLPFQQQLLRLAAASPDRHTLQVGEIIEEFYPPASSGLVGSVSEPDGTSLPVTLMSQGEEAVARFSETRVSGLYHVRSEGQPERVFAVNPPEQGSVANSESNLKRIDSGELKKSLELYGPIQTVSEFGQVIPSSESGAILVSAPKPHGPWIARIAVLLAVGILLAETFVAWRWGPSRATGAGSDAGSVRHPERKWFLRLISSAVALVPLAAALLLFFTLFHFESTNNLLGFLPANAKQQIEQLAGVPAALPGEGTKWRLEGSSAFVRNSFVDRRIVLAIAGVCVLITVLVYRAERKAAHGLSRLLLPALLRASVLLLALFVLLPQLRLMFDREGWPEVVILVDTSASMSTVDQLKDPAVRAKAEELLKASGLTEAHRLKLAQLLLTQKDGDWLERLLSEKEVKVHVYAVDAATRSVSSLEQAGDAREGRTALMKLEPVGDSSHLGEGVEAVLKTFQGSSLAAIVMLTDGVTTAGDDLPKAAREAARAGVPLYLVGVGDVWETPDIQLADLRAEDSITVGDKLVLDARLTPHGQVPPDPLTVTLYEKVRGQLVERGRTTVTPNSNSTPVPVTVSYTPTEPGERTFVLVAASVPGETDLSNNRIEHTVLVTDAKRLRLLYIEGYPRYDFRFIKVLLEREAERSLGGKGLEIETILLDAPQGWAEIDRSAFRGDFPTRDQLFGYDAIIMGDIDPKKLDPKHLPRAMRTLQDLSDYVRVKGGGVLFLCGEHGTPAAFADSPLAEILPVTVEEGAGGKKPEGKSEEFRPRLTELGRQHSLFRFAPDPVESENVWNRLPPLYWFARNYRIKANASVLAVHPTQPAPGGKPGEGYPLVAQAHVGPGTVLFLGFDDTWRWRFRNNEENFDRFWIQAVRFLSRTKLRRIELRVEPKATFRRDEKINVVVRFPVEMPPPPPQQPVKVTLARSPLTNPDGSSGPGKFETTVLTLSRLPGSGVQFGTTLTKTPEGEYRFTLTDPEPQGGLSPPTALVQVLPPLGEKDRVEMNVADLNAAAAISNGGFYTLANAQNIFDELKALQKIPLNQPCPPLEVWNHPGVFLLIFLLLAVEWLLRKRERLL